MSPGRPGGSGAASGFRLGPAQTPRAIKEILIALLVVFVLQVVLMRAGFAQVVEWCALTGSSFWKGMVWQPLTAVFMHDDRNLFHLLGNAFLIWMFGSPVAEQLGRRRFHVLFLGGGAAAGLLKMLLVLGFHVMGWQWSLLEWGVPSVGASGAVFVLLAWYCLSWPDREISLLFVPIVFSARQALPLWFVVEFGFSSGGNIDHVIHVAGVAVGWLWLVIFKKRGGRPGGRLSPPPPRRPKLRVVRDDEGPVFH